MRLAGKRALVTGAQQGIGRAAVLALAKEGADVAINWLDGEAAALLAPRRLNFYSRQPAAFDYTKHVYGLMGAGGNVFLSMSIEAEAANASLASSAAEIMNEVKPSTPRSSQFVS